MKKILLFALLMVSGIAYSQVDIQIEELTPEDDDIGYNVDTLKRWVTEIFNGPGGMIDTSTIRFTGNHQAFGRFFNGTDIGFQKGLIISNGKVESVEAPNSNGAKSDFFNTGLLANSGDEDLLGMYNSIFTGLGGKDTAINYTGDAAALEFVYRPFGNYIKMDYVFASEEYPTTAVQPSRDVDLTGFDGTNQIYDLFGISIRKSGFYNLAYTNETGPSGPPPDPQRWITVGNVNSSNNSSYYQPNPPPLGPGLGTQFDGLTKNIGDLGPMYVYRNDIDPCGYYNVKIVIEDFWYSESPDPELLPNGFVLNSALFLKENGLDSKLQATNTYFSEYDVEHEYSRPELTGELVEECNFITATFTLRDTINIDYSIPFKIEPPGYSQYVEVAYEGGEVITNDTITFYHGDSIKTITIKAINLDADYPNIQFRYYENPCDYPTILGGTGFNGKIPFNLRDNEPITFSENPKVYEAYCKETIELTIADVTENGVDPLSYYWNGDIVNHETINYQVQSSPDYVNILVNDGCDNENNGVIKINNKPVILEQILDAFLCGPGQFADVPVSAIQPNYADYTIDHVSWYKGTQFLGDADGNVIHVVYDETVGDGIWTCNFEITDCCGGTQTGEFLVNQSELTLGDDVWICKGEEKELIANVTAQSFKWYEVNNPSVTLSIINSVIVSPEVTTEYALEILDDCGETQTAYITVNVDLFEPVISINPATAEICAGDTITLSGNPAVEWTWTPGGEQTQSITLYPTVPNTYEYTLTASSEYCFDKVTTATFEVFPNPVAEFSINPYEGGCTDEEITFTYADIITNETFAWDFDDGSPISTVGNPTHIYTLADTYFVNLHVDKYICEKDTTVELIINPLPTPNFDADILNGCVPVEVQFEDLSGDVQSGATYQWDFGDGSTSNVTGSTTYEYTQAGLFNVSLTINNTARCGATMDKPNYIQVNPNPDAGFDPNPPITTMDNPVIEFIDSTNSVDPINYYKWDFGDGSTPVEGEENPSHTYSMAGSYDVVLFVETTNGCIDYDTVKVALTEEAILFIPNAFTPNGDGVNDKFEIKGTPIADYNLYIYNRWGQVIWSTHDFNTHWDGTDRDGNIASAGSYVYQVTGTDYLEQAVNYQGTVTVIR